MIQIRLCGLGGQGLVVAGEMLARAAFQEKKAVSLTSSYGSQVRGGITRSDLVLSDGFIDFPMVTQIDFMITMLQTAYQESLPQMKTGGKVFFDSTLVKPAPGSPGRMYPLPATDIAVKELQSEMAANIILLAAANSISQFVSEASLEEAIRRGVPARFLDLNIKAVHLGLDWARQAA
jgi:2-oxoglutarate ferredoxin oxidoreductase subunit gamma